MAATTPQPHKALRQGSHAVRMRFVLASKGGFYCVAPNGKKIPLNQPPVDDVKPTNCHQLGKEKTPLPIR